MRREKMIIKGVEARLVADSQKRGGDKSNTLNMEETRVQGTT